MKQEVGAVGSAPNYKNWHDLPNTGSSASTATNKLYEFTATEDTMLYAYTTSYGLSAGRYRVWAAIDGHMICDAYVYVNGDYTGYLPIFTPLKKGSKIEIHTGNNKQYFGGSYVTL